MVNFPPIIPVGNAAHTVSKELPRQIVPSTVSGRRQLQRQDRRRMHDRRLRYGTKQLMDQRYGPDRRRSINLSV